MRVYEFAREHNLTSKEIIELLSKAHFSVGSHMSILTDEQRAYLEKQVNQKAVKKVETNVKPVVADRVEIKKLVEKKTNISVEKNVPVKPMPSSEPKTSQMPRHNIFIEDTVDDGEDNLPVVTTPSLRKSFTHEKGRTLMGGLSGEEVRRRRRKGPPKDQKKFSPPPVVITEVTITQELPLHAAAQLMGKPVGDLIVALLKQGKAYNRNHVLSIDTVVDLAKSFNLIVHQPELPDESFSKKAIDVSTKDMIKRWPIIVVMGHVDHGKTSFLDYIRKMNTAAKEKGGITQHLAAYEVESAHGKVIFLDTPGHKAFSYVRQQGTKITDIVVLVVAADDGVMPQTVEAIRHAKEAGVPIIVAINKIDKVEDRVGATERIKRQLVEHKLVAEDWGGDVICVPISSKTGEGIAELVEMIVLQADMMDLKANPSAPAQAFVLESKLERGYGPVATVIGLQGTMHQGDYFVCGPSSGRIRLIINNAGQKIAQVGPSIPVHITGFSDFSALSDVVKVVDAKEYAKARLGQTKLTTQRLAPSGVGQSSILSAQEEKVSIKLLIKTDMQGSLQAIQNSLTELAKQHKNIPASFHIVYSGVGDISERDIALATDMGAQICGLHVKTERNALVIAKEKEVEIQTFDIIYNLVGYLESLLLRHRIIKKQFQKVGEAVVRKVFDIKGVGIIAGCYVQEGVFSRNCKVVCIRQGKTLGEGFIVTLQREKKTVKEVHRGHECGFSVKGFQEWQEEDVVHAFTEVVVDSES